MMELTDCMMKNQLCNGTEPLFPKRCCSFNNPFMSVPSLVLLGDKRLLYLGRFQELGLCPPQARGCGCCFLTRESTSSEAGHTQTHRILTGLITQTAMHHVLSSTPT